VREVVKEIYRYSKSIPPTLIILIDKLNDISKGLIQELTQHYDIVSVTSPEISKIIDEAKKAANID
jgi:MinD-like ATPase involved in chromosome partitioning or flagellar assembly